MRIWIIRNSGAGYLYDRQTCAGGVNGFGYVWGRNAFGLDS